MLSLPAHGGLFLFSPSSNKSLDVAFRRIVLLLWLLVFPLSSALWRLQEIVPDLRKAIYLLRETNSRVNDSFHTCRHARMVTDILSRGQSSAHIWIIDSLRVTDNNPTENNQISRFFFHFKWSPLSLDNSPFIINHFPLFINSQMTATLASYGALTPEKKVLNASGLSCNLKLIKRQLMWGVHTVIGEWVILLVHQL